MKNRKMLLTAALFGGMVLLSSIFSLQGALLEDLIAHYNLSDSAQGLAGAVSSVGGVIALAVSFFLMGRVRKFGLLKVAFAICSAALAALFFIPSFAVFVLIWGCIGVGLGFVDTLLSACMSDLYHGEEKKATRMMCMLHMTYGLASMALPVLYSLLKSWRMPWYGMYAVVGGFGAVLLMFTLFASAGHEKAETSARSSFSAKEIARTVTAGALPFFILAMFFHGYFLAGLNTWITSYIGVTLDSGIGDISLTFLFAGVMLSRFLFPFTGLKTEKYICFSCILSAVFLLCAVLSGNGVAAAVLVALSGLAFGATIPCMLNLACEGVPENTMLATTPMMLSLYLGEAAAPPLIGVMESTVGLHWGMISCCVIMLVTALFCFLAAARCGKEKKHPAGL